MDKDVVRKSKMIELVNNLSKWKDILINAAYLILVLITINYIPLVSMILFCVSNCILVGLMVCKLQGKDCRLNWLYNGWTVVSFGLIGFLLQSEYHLVDHFFVTVLLLISAVAGMSFVYFLNKTNIGLLALWSSVLISFSITLGCYGQILFINDFFSTISRHEYAVVVEKTVVDGRAKQLTPDYYVTLHGENLDSVRVFINKDVFKTVTCEKAYNVTVYKGCFNICFLKDSELKSTLGEEFYE